MLTRILCSVFAALLSIGSSAALPSIAKTTPAELKCNKGICVYTTNPSWDPVTEERDWSAVVSPERCYRIARRTGRRVVEVIDTTKGDLRYICIFEPAVQ